MDGCGRGGLRLVPITPSPRAAAPRILVVDDNAHVRRMLCRTIEVWREAIDRLVSEDPLAEV
jgi:hypothetical protein